MTKLLQARTLNDITYSERRGKFCFRLEEDYTVTTGISGYSLEKKYYRLDRDGLLTIKAGYRWNRDAYGLGVDSIMRGSLVHDCLCQMICRGQLPAKPCRLQSNILLCVICDIDGMSKGMREVVYSRVRTI